MGKSTKVGMKRRDSINNFSPTTIKIIKELVKTSSYKKGDNLLVITEPLERRTRKSDRERMGIDTTLGVLKVVNNILDNTKEGE